MAEWTKATVLKTVMGATSSWVRIPLPPPVSGVIKPQTSSKWSGPFFCNAHGLATNFSWAVFFRCATIPPSENHIRVGYFKGMGIGSRSVKATGRGHRAWLPSRLRGPNLGPWKTRLVLTLPVRFWNSRTGTGGPGQPPERLYPTGTSVTLCAWSAGNTSLPNRSRFWMKRS